jgi:hypothetical protein
MKITPPTNQDERADLWAERQRAWQRRLGRLRLGAEPLEEQLARYRRVTWALTAIPTAIGVLFVALFTAFHRPDIGLIVAAVLFVPVVGWAWVEDWRLHRRAASYEAERRAFWEGRGDPLGRPPSAAG